MPTRHRLSRLIFARAGWLYRVFRHNHQHACRETRVDWPLMPLCKRHTLNVILATMPLTSGISPVPKVPCITAGNARNEDAGLPTLPADRKLPKLLIVPCFAAQSTACLPDGGSSAAWQRNQGQRRASGLVIDASVLRVNPEVSDIDPGQGGPRRLHPKRRRRGSDPVEGLGVAEHAAQRGLIAG